MKPLAVVVLLLLGGCVAAWEEQECLKDVPLSSAISVSSGTKPSFHWSSGKVRSLVVVEEGAQLAESQRIQWAIDQLPEHTGGFPSPVSYPSVPATGQQHTQPKELVVGKTYELMVGDYLMGPWGARPCFAPGRISFTP